MDHEENKSAFSMCKSQGMGMLIRNRNALIMICHIISCHYSKFFREEGLGEDECYFYFRDVRTKPEMTDSQKKTALKNLVSYGFIEILEDKRKIFSPGCKKIRIIANPFSKEFGDSLKQENPYRGYPCFD